MAELAENKENAPPQIGRIADEIKRLNQFTQEHKLPETLQETSENLRSGQDSEALESGREAEQTLTELAQGLDNAMAFMEGANANETLTVMREAVESALHLSHLHEESLSETSRLRVATQTDAYNTSEVLQLQKLAGDEISTAEGVSRLSSKLWELGNRQIEVPPEVVWHLNASNDALSRAARALEDRQPTLAMPIQKSALADLNQANLQTPRCNGTDESTNGCQRYGEHDGAAPAACRQSRTVEPDGTEPEPTDARTGTDTRG